MTIAPETETETETETGAPAQAVSNYTRVTLSEPILRGEQKIETLNLRKPKAGELRGLSLADVITSDITALLTLIPRISEPSLTSVDVDALDPADLVEIGGAIRGFFMTKAEKVMMETMMAQQV